MKGNMLICAPLCLLLCWLQPAVSKKIFIGPEANRDIRMSMVEDAVDDMYSGCNETMMKMIKNKYFKKENTGIFKDVWKKAERCANDDKHKDKQDNALTKDHRQAICVYTSNYKEFYKTFNTAVRTGRKMYRSSFPFHSLHFWLTSAIQILNNKKECHNTYRRSKAAYTGKVNQIIRFGFFASSSRRTDLTQFGSKTCFKIETCSGAYLKKYPQIQDEEQEVLIPPYEKFKIVDKKQNNFVENLTDCKVVYTLKSAGIESNLNCHAVK